MSKANLETNLNLAAGVSGTRHLSKLWSSYECSGIPEIRVIEEVEKLTP